MRISRRQQVGALAMAVALVAIAPAAQAFFPYGGWTVNDKTVFIKWPIAVMDTNHDGDVSGPNEGVPYWVEDGANGFDTNQIQIVQDAFAVWQNVPTAYVAFSMQGTIREPLQNGTAGEDHINTVSVAYPDEAEASLVGAGIGGITIFDAAVDDVVEQNVEVTGGTLLEADIVINGSLLTGETPGQPAAIGLEAMLVHQIGRFVGLDQTPLNNLTEVPGLANYIDPAVLALRNASGQLVSVGATPTMFQLVFQTEAPSGQLYFGMVDLAPDDIAGVSFLYPRGSQDLFFSVNQEVRSLSSYAFPSSPIAGSHIVAWADVDDNPGTQRVPLFSTMSGLYTGRTADYDNLRGRFQLKGLYKQLESFSSEFPFAVTYTFTSGPLDGSGYERQAPPDMAPGDFDSTNQGGAADPGYETVFYSQVFHEAGDLFGVEKFETGTALYFDSDRQKLVGVVSGRTLDNMLQGFRPMFGDRMNQCPYNVASTGLKTGEGPTLLRRLRDGVLLHTVLGSAFVDTYYRLAPDAARFLLDHRLAKSVAHGAVCTMEGMLLHKKATALVLVMFATLFAGVLRIRSRKAVLGVLFAAGLLGSTAAHATILMWNTEDMLQHSDEVISGTVASVTVRPNDNGRPVTDIQITVTGKAKGSANKGASVFIEQLGGRVGNRVTVVGEYPRFKEGEEVVLYLNYNEVSGQYMVTAGQRGKLDVVTNAKTGVKTVRGVEMPTAKSLDAEPDGGVALDDYLSYLRGIVREQEAASTTP